MNRRPVTVVRSTAAGGYDDNGDPVSGTETSTTLDGCLVAPRYDTGETHDRGRSGVIVGLTVYAPVDADILRTDQIEVDGERYDVEGEPGRWVGSRVGGLEVALRRAAG